MKIITLSAVLAVLAMPGAALAEETAAQNGAQSCKTQRTAMGKVVFATTYGTNASRSNAFGKCVAKAAKASNTAKADATAACRAEESDAGFAAAHSGKSFAEFYGSGKKGKNAFAKCVNGKAKANRAAQTKALVNAAKQCKSERAAMGAGAFADKYGTNASKRNAFGKCVSSKNKAYAIPS